MSEPTRELVGVALGVAYHGAGFHGFASQPNTRTVSGELLSAVQRMSPQVEQLRGLSRTDAGVHARAQVVTFDTERSIDARGWVLGLNHHLPGDVAVRFARKVPVGFNPRFASLGKRYEYTLLTDPLPDPLHAAHSWHISRPFDRELAERELAQALGTHDFSAFRSATDQRPSAVREITRTELLVAEDDPRLVRLAVEGTAFLHNMVRILVGTVVDVATKRMQPGSLAAALQSGKRTDAGRTAPPQGLLLHSAAVEWPEPTGEVWPPSE